jgi:mannose-1-phosphate guanylyltransferase
MMLKKKLSFFILAGGVGSRLWPLSDEKCPKQFLDLSLNGISLLQKTLIRLQQFNEMRLNFDITIIANFENRFIVLEQLRQINMQDCKIILEPCNNDTFSSVMVGLIDALKNESKTAVILPSDHFIEDQSTFLRCLNEAINLSKETNKITTLGIKPTFASTVHGYINFTNQNNITFVEKPNKQKACEYLASGNYLWNSGIFVLPVFNCVKQIQEIDESAFLNIEKAYESIKKEHLYCILNEKYFKNVEKISFDYAIMEKISNISVVNCENLQIDDLGNFNALYNHFEKDINQNLILGKKVELNATKNSFFINKTGQNFVIKNLENILMIANNNNVMLTKLKNDNSCSKHWGNYENIFHEANIKVKKITILPEQRISFQFHNHRDEHWFVVSGEAEVKIENELFSLSPNQSIYIPAKTKHYIKNLSKTNNLIFIEVQYGSLISEDDIVRIN